MKVSDISKGKKVSLNGRNGKVVTIEMGKTGHKGRPATEYFVEFDEGGLLSGNYRAKDLRAAK